MHRQSLGSPSSKLHAHTHTHTHGGPKEDSLALDEPKRRDSVSPTPPKPDKLIHLIPVLTLVCFFILYLCSHTPSPSDLAQFTGFKRSPKHLDTAAEISDIGEYTERKRGDVLAIRSLRNLQEIGKQSRKSHPHRKLADF